LKLQQVDTIVMPWYNNNGKRKRARRDWKGVSARNAVTWNREGRDPLGWGSMPPAVPTAESAPVTIRFVSTSQ